MGLAMALRTCMGLRSIELEGNRIGDAGIIALMESLGGCSELTRIVLRSNQIGDAGARCIAQKLPECRKLGALDLSYNLVGNPGAAQFSKTFELGPHPAMKELLLNNNDIGLNVKLQLRTSALQSQGQKMVLRL